MNIFLIAIAPTFLFFILTYIDRNTNIPTDFAAYRNATAITAILSIISLLTIVPRKLDQFFEADNGNFYKDENKLSVNKQPSRLGLWDAFSYKFYPSKKNASLLSEIREEYRATNVKVTEFDWDTIVAGTDKFSDSNVIGRGESGTTTIYKAVFPPSEEFAAVKRFSPSSGLVGLDKFLNELLLLPKLEHPNIIKLLGYCIHKQEKLLVYELMPVTSTLDSLVYGICNRLTLYLRLWSLRFKIIMGIAQGFCYLHEDSGLRVVHGDLKLSNILLDVKMNAKISGFALARSRTTYGNMSTSESYVQMKSDVYRFGVIVLAMVSGTRLTTDLDITSLVDNTWELWYKGLELAAVNKSIIGTRGVDNEERRCIRVGLLCTLKNPDDRPPMSLVLKILEEKSVSPQTDDDDDDYDLASRSSDNENDTEGNAVTLELDDDIAIL
ncbi:hypothetical protein ABFS83_08G078300 [Erythranthe nasuta]